MPPKLYTLTETAAIFRVSKQVFAEPFYRTIGRAKLFTDQDIAQLYEAMGSPSKSSNAATRPAAADRPEAPNTRELRHSCHGHCRKNQSGPRANSRLVRSCNRRQHRNRTTERPFMSQQSKP
jgi:hypothetical protein